MNKIVRDENLFWVGESKENPSGFIKFRPTEDNPEVLIAASTVVKPELRGQGMAEKLLNELTSYARENNFKIKAQCSYVVRKFNEDNSYDDVNVDAGKDIQDPGICEIL
ncbi:GNAT family N-acetyltransferase [Anaerosphaera multitolerans]|uniref:N-acetyltransferase n=1 Tax=Anaerosphaera multitolerans TaxID=2487351 RepID=A0A437S5A8_9FIRM|nr:GNAT family N-acetyltransferase [Anaerosphaera multitolerans]RVU54215.1 N-acetyltransferase [Anaerosphaera multitolerans]